jgi:hypothetical protein
LHFLCPQSTQLASSLYFSFLCSAFAQIEPLNLFSV